MYEGLTGKLFDTLLLRNQSGVSFLPVNCTSIFFMWQCFWSDTHLLVKTTAGWCIICLFFEGPFLIFQHLPGIPEGAHPMECSVFLDIRLLVRSARGGCLLFVCLVTIPHHDLTMKAAARHVYVCVCVCGANKTSICGKGFFSSFTCFHGIVVTWQSKSEVSLRGGLIPPCCYGNPHVLLFAAFSLLDR